MPKPLVAILLSLPPLLLSPQCHAQLYKWVDDKGVMHYSDNKFEAGQAAVSELRSNAAPAAVLPAGVSWQQRDAEFRRRQQYKLLAQNARARRPTEQTLQASSCTPDSGACR